MSELYEHPLFTGLIPYYNKVMDTLETIYEGPNKCSTFNEYYSPKLKSFTQIKGRRRLSKKKRKQLKTKKQ
jgi:hypothetical protein